MEELKKTEIKIELDEQTANGIYSNLVLISHSETEFVFDFMFSQPQTNKVKVRSRVILSPKQAKKVLEALKQNISKYESHFGQISLPPQVPSSKIQYFN